MHVGEERYKVIADPQDRCALWPADCPTPATWRDIGVVGTARMTAAFLDDLLASAPRMRRWFERGTQQP